MHDALDVPADSTPVRFVGRVGFHFAVALLVAVLAVVAWNGGPRFSVAQPTVEVPASALVAVRGRGHAEPARYVVDAADAEGIVLLAAGGVSFAAADYPRITWHLPWDVPSGLQVNIAWRRRDAPGRLYSEAVEWSRGPAYIDLNGHPDWSGTIQEISLAIRGRIAAPLPVGGVRLRSAAWSVTLVDTLSDWRDRALVFAPGGFSSLDGERAAIAPLVPVVAGAVGIAIAALGWRARRRGARFPLGAAIGVFIAGWLVVDLRTQWHFARQHAANLAIYTGKSGDDRSAASPDGRLFETARKLRDATRERPARVLVLSDNTHLATRIAWFFYPENVWHGARSNARRPAVAPDQLRTGDQVVLVLYEAITWDPARQALVWQDGRTRAATPILVEGPALAMVRVDAPR